VHLRQLLPSSQRVVTQSALTVGRVGARPERAVLLQAFLHLLHKRTKLGLLLFLHFGLMALHALEYVFVCDLLLVHSPSFLFGYLWLSAGRYVGGEVEGRVRPIGLGFEIAL